MPTTGERAPPPEPRVLLCPPACEDRETFLALVAASRALHHPWVDPPEDRVGFAAWSERIASGRCAGFLVRLCGSGGIVGVVNLNEIERLGGAEAALGFYGFAGSAGRGYVGEGIALLLERGFGELGLDRVRAQVRADNRRSVALLRAQGFRRERGAPRLVRVGGAWREHESWALRARSWRAHHRPRAATRA